MKKTDKIFIIGLNKTGTTSISKALELMDFNVLPKTVDMYKNMYMEDIDDEEIINSIKKNQYDVLSDAPWHILYKQLDLSFPNSKFILTVRNPDEWFDSVYDYYYTEGKDSLFKLTKHIFGVSDKNYSNQPVFPKHRSLFIENYLRHNEDVHKYFANRNDQLLVLNMETDFEWRKICNFLKCNEPDVDFPNENKNRSNSNYAKKIKRNVKILFNQVLYNHKK